jgi:hypothetical protein
VTLLLCRFLELLVITAYGPVQKSRAETKLTLKELVCYSLRCKVIACVLLVVCGIVFYCE